MVDFRLQVGQKSQLIFLCTAAALPTCAGPPGMPRCAFSVMWLVMLVRELLDISGDPSRVGTRFYLLAAKNTTDWISALAAFCYAD